MAVAGLAQMNAANASDRWTLIGKAGDGAELLVDAASIKVVDGGYRTALELLNYRGDGARKQSLLSGALYDCTGWRKRDQFVAKYDDHWAEGRVLSNSSLEEKWVVLMPKSLGGSMYRFVCDFAMGKASAT